MLVNGRRILLTGGCGAIGLVAARALTDAGAVVVVNDILQPEEARARLDDERIHYVQADGSDESGAAHMLAAACAVAGPLTDVILLAGIVRTGGLLEQSAENFDAMFRVNVLAAALTAQAAVRGWRDTASVGNLVFVSSWVQDVPWPGIAPYSASKAALPSMASVRMSWHPALSGWGWLASNGMRSPIISFEPVAPYRWASCRIHVRWQTPWFSSARRCRLT